MFNTRVSKKVFHQAVSNGTTRELAFMLSVKRRTSTIKGKNLSCIHKSLGEIAGCSSATARRYLNSLVAMKAVSISKHNGYVYASFGKTRARKVQDRRHLMWWTPRHSDIILNESNTTFKTYKDIELALRALYIVDKQSVRDFFSQTVKLVGDPEPGTTAKTIRQAKKKLHRYGKESFTDKGMSNKYLRQQLKCGTTSLRNTIAYGETIGLFVRILPQVTFVKVGLGQGHKAFDYTDGQFSFGTYSYVAIVDGATKYALT